MKKLLQIWPYQIRILHTYWLLARWTKVPSVACQLTILNRNETCCPKAPYEQFIDN